MLNLVSIDDKVLHTRAKEIETFDEALLDKFSDMFKVLLGMKYGSKLGMAFPQVGVPLRGVIVLGVAMANPIFTPAKQQTIKVDEGCYSLTQGETHKRIRAQYGWLKYQNPMNGEWIEEKVNGLKSIVVQHEIDHIDGLLCNRPLE